MLLSADLPKALRSGLLPAPGRIVRTARPGRAILEHWSEADALLRAYQLIDALT